jgi:predicted PurR-regulated permease PerM
MNRARTRRVELLVPVRTLLVVSATIGVLAAFVAIGDTFLIVFVGIFLALVFEYPVRFVMRKTRMSRGLAATVTVIGSAIVVTVLFILLLVPILSVAGGFFGVFLGLFTILFICLFLLTDIAKLKASLGSVLMPGEDERWLGVWERVTASVSRWAIGVVVIATIAGTVQGTTAWLLGSSYAVALGVIAGLLDMIPNIGATISGFILVPTLWAEQGIGAAVIMLVVILVYQQLENNILTPKIQGKAVDLSAFFIIVSVTLFGALLGVLGALTAVPLAAMIQIFVQELTKARRERVAEAKAIAARSPTTT